MRNLQMLKSTGVILAVLLTSDIALAGETLQSFVLREAFGVSHPRQIVRFPLDKGVSAKASRASVTDSEGNPVPFQVLGDDHLAIDTDLPAKSSKTWYLRAEPTDAKNSGREFVTVAEKDSFFEITNGIVGVRVPLAARELSRTPAPIQGVRFRDGQWTAAGPNALSLTARSMAVRFRERGPLVVTIEIDYSFENTDPKLSKEDRYYRSTITVQAGQPSVMFEEDANVDISYSLSTHLGLEPTQARYRGHNATSPALGHAPDGRVYRNWHEQGTFDALVDLQYAKPQSFRRMAVWDPWVFDSGWYWQLCNEKAGDSSNLLGIFAGPGSRALGAANSGVNVFTAPIGVIDLVTQGDSKGNIHAVYQTGDEHWYRVIDASLHAGIMTGVIRI